MARVAAAAAGRGRAADAGAVRRRLQLLLPARQPVHEEGRGRAYRRAAALAEGSRRSAGRGRPRHRPRRRQRGPRQGRQGFEPALGVLTLTDVHRATNSEEPQMMTPAEIKFQLEQRLLDLARDGGSLPTITGIHSLVMIDATTV